MHNTKLVQGYIKRNETLKHKVIGCMFKTKIHITHIVFQENDLSLPPSFTPLLLATLALRSCTPLQSWYQT